MASVTAILVTGNDPDQKAIADRKALADRLRAASDQITTLLLAHDGELDLGSLQSDAIAMVGHSFGGDQCVEWAKASPQSVVAISFLLDPVPKQGWRRYVTRTIGIPDNMPIVTCFHREGWFVWPFSKAIDVVRPGLTNFPVDIGHNDFFGNADIVSAVSTAIVDLANH
jgi:hypothetical protein